MVEPKFVPYEPVKTTDGRFIIIQQDHQVLQSRRQQLGLTQQQVADRSHILLRQYQRLESGEQPFLRSSIRIGLSVCAALLLNPYEFLPGTIDQPDPSTMKPQDTYDFVMPDIDEPKRRGRKPIERNVMAVYLNHERYSVLIPGMVLEAMGKPEYIQLLHNLEDKHLAIKCADSDAEEAMDVPGLVYEGYFLSIPGPEFSGQLRESMHWTDAIYKADTRLATAPDGRLAAVIDLSAAQPTQFEAEGFAVPNVFS